MNKTGKLYALKGGQKAESPAEVLEALRKLRERPLDEETFWEIFLSSVSVLCMAPVVLLCKKKSSGWSVSREYISSESVSGRAEELAGPARPLLDEAAGKGFAFDRLRTPLPPLQAPLLLAVALDAPEGEDGRSALLMVLDQETPQQLNETILRTQLIRDIPLHRPGGKRAAPAGAEGSGSRLLAHALEIIDAVLRTERFPLSALTLVNEIAGRFACSQVSLGWSQGNYVRAYALSRVERFDRHGEAVRRLESVFEEAYEQEAVLSWPETNAGQRVTRAHREYAEACGLTQLLSIPVRIDDRVIAVVTLEKRGSALEPLEADAVNLALGMVARWLELLHRNDRWIGGRLALWSRKRLASLLGVEHTLAKAAIILLAVALAYGAIGTWPYRIDGPAVLRTDSVSFVSAPFDGVVQNVLVQEGDVVKAGQPLLALDEKELRLREAETEAEIMRHQREAGKQRAAGELADMRIAMSQAREAQAELEKIRHYLSLARVTARDDGFVVEGDRQELIGLPVSRGDVLLKTARVESMYAYIRVSERDISDLPVKSKGVLRLVSRPGRTFPVTVDQVIPMAMVDSQEGNVFLVKARIDARPEPWWRPGMSGVAKLDAGRHRVLWLLTHRLADFVRMHLWW